MSSPRGRRPAPHPHVWEVGMSEGKGIFVEYSSPYSYAPTKVVRPMFYLMDDILTTRSSTIIDVNYDEGSVYVYDTNDSDNLSESFDEHSSYSSVVVFEEPSWEYAERSEAPA
nr:uncharacterized protein CI109_001416 [Kwoniella shandongensis]KAA5530013.1 hypothetical protein CI109_001416 [Kwoniella shandongensis]